MATRYRTSRIPPTPIKAPADSLYEDTRGRRIRQPQVIVAEAGDDFTTLAEKVGADPLAMQQANGDATQPMAGAAYNIPRVPTGFLEQEAAATNQVVEIAKRREEEAAIAASNAAYYERSRMEGETNDEWVARLARLDAATQQPAPAPTPAPEPSFWDRLTDPDPDPGELGTPEFWAENPVGKWLWGLFGKANEKEQSYIDPTGGVGIGAGVFGWGGGGVTEPTPITGIPRVPAGFLEQEAATENQAVIDAQNAAYYEHEMQRRPELYEEAAPLEPTIYGDPEVPDYYKILHPDYHPEGFVDPLDQEFYKDVAAPTEYVERGERGVDRLGILVRKIERDIGISLNPEQAFQGIMDGSILDAILEQYADDPGTLDYMERMGLLVPVDNAGQQVTVGGSTPQGLTQKYTYPTAAYYGGGGYNTRRPSSLGLVSWSI